MEASPAKIKIKIPDLAAGRAIEDEPAVSLPGRLILPTVVSSVVIVVLAVGLVLGRTRPVRAQAGETKGNTSPHPQ